MRPSAVVDTVVVSYVFKDDSRSEMYRPLLEGRFLFVSFMTVAELDRWALARHWGEGRRQELEAYLGQYGVYTPDRRLCLEWAKVMEEGRSNGQPLSVPDAWVAATARIFEIPLITHNRKHYAGVSDLRILSLAP